MRLLTVCLLGAVVLCAEGGEGRIGRVENGLRPGVVLSGQALPKWTVAERMKFYNVPGVSVAVVVNGRIEWARGYGVTARDGRPVDAQTLFQAASLSKPVTAMTALRLVDQGKLALDEDVNLKLRSWKVPEDEFTKTEKVTLRRLLNHSAGLTVHGFGGYGAGEPVPTLVELLDGKKPANSAPIRVDLVPGTRMRYSGGGYEVVQQLVMDVTGKPFAQDAQELVLQPLGMTRSGYMQPLPESLWANAAAGHRGNGVVLNGRWHTYPELAAAGWWTTPSDLARFMIELQRGGHVLRPETQKTMLTKLLGNYGLGISLGETAGRKGFGHGGANEGFRCMMFGYLDGSSGAVVMTNGDRGDSLANEILHSISAEYGWVDYKTRERTAVRVAPEILREYAGRYVLRSGLEVVISVKDGRLIASALGETVEFFAESPVSFFALESDIPDLRFTRGADGSVELSTGDARAKREPVGK
jgi:CubicO group peptidase (beta-lactamase class C family)